MEAKSTTLQSHIDTLFVATPEKVPPFAEGLKLYRSDVSAALRKLLDQADGNRDKKENRFRTACVLATLGEVDSLVLDTIFDNIGSVSDQEFRIVFGSFENARDLVVEPLWQRVQTETDSQSKGRLAAIALVLGDPSPARFVLAIGPARSSKRSRCFANRDSF